MFFSFLVKSGNGRSGAPRSRALATFAPPSHPNAIPAARAKPLPVNTPDIANLKPAATAAVPKASCAFGEHLEAIQSCVMSPVGSIKFIESLFTYA